MRDEGLYFDDILEASEHVDQFLNGVTYEQFLESEILKSAVVQKLTVIGEAASRIADSTRGRYPHIKWKSIKGLRNIAVHQYFEIDWDIIWKTARNLVGPLAADIARIIEKDFPMPDDETVE